MNEAEYWKAVCTLSKQNLWQGQIPHINWDVRNAIESLIAQQPEIWDHHETIPTLLKTNVGVAEIFAEYDDVEIAYALRLARYARAR